MRVEEVNPLKTQAILLIHMNPKPNCMQASENRGALEVSNTTGGNIVQIEPISLEQVQSNKRVLEFLCAGGLQGFTQALHKF